MTQRLALLALSALTLAACTQFPELEGTVAPEVTGASYPELVPLEPILANVAPTEVDPVQTEATLNARITGLRARAAGMRGAVLSGAEKKRLDEGARGS